MMVIGPRRIPLIVAVVICWLFAPGTTAVVADTVEFLNGTQVEGKITAIRKEKREFDFEMTVGGRTLTRTYAYSQVHAVTLKGKRYVLTKKPAGRVEEGQSSTRRTRSEVERQIRRLGATPPDWLEQTQLDYPPTLDLSWPLGAPKGGWNNQKNVGQFIWDVVNPNPGRWRSGIKLMYHLIERHSGDRAKLARDYRALGGMYFRFFQDYPRAAYWLRRSGGLAGGEKIMLAECYWRLGNESMALDMLRGRSLPLSAIKLLGDMGKTRRAVSLADAFTRSGRNPDAWILAGDALRQAGRYPEAVRYYEKALASKAFRNPDYEKRGKARARNSIEAIRLFQQTDPSQVADGTYRATSDGYNGPIEVEVQVASGRIETVKVIRHREKQFYAALTETPAQIIGKQSVQGIDATSRATITSQAIIHATAKALARGAKRP